MYSSQSLLIMFILLTLYSLIFFLLHEEGRIKEFFGTQPICIVCDVLRRRYSQLGRQLEKDLRKCLQVGLRLEDASPD